MQPLLSAPDKPTAELKVAQVWGREGQRGGKPEFITAAQVKDSGPWASPQPSGRGPWSACRCQRGARQGCQQSAAEEGAGEASATSCPDLRRGLVFWPITSSTPHKRSPALPSWASGSSCSRAPLRASSGPTGRPVCPTFLDTLASSFWLSSGLVSRARSACQAPNL